MFRKVVAPVKDIVGYRDASSVMCEFEAIDVSNIMQITKVEIFCVEKSQVVENSSSVFSSLEVRAIGLPS